MRAVVQRVTKSLVTVNNKTVGKISKGLLIFLGVEKADTEKDLDYLVQKIVHARIFQDDANKMNLSILDIAGEVLVISQFTLCANVNKGNRPSFNNAENPQTAEIFYNKSIEAFSKFVHTEKGIFGEMMNIEIVNTGPVTILYDSKKKINLMDFLNIFIK
ncbi:MAG: D-tyrosyl-tRNA(Tyr) deacylase [Bacteroidetes bacterium]|nr:D-tyrosyl-tRNA(Tyr) deacylase [Bacteroidota bacterium]